MSRSLLKLNDTFKAGEDVRSERVRRVLNWMASLCLRVENFELEGPGVEYFENAGSRLAARIKGRPAAPPGGSSLKLVRIDENATLFSKTIQWGNTGSAVSTAVAWTYGGVECRLDTSSPDGSVVAVSGGQEFSASGSPNPAIYNPHEWSATTTIVGGIEVDSSNFPAGNRYRPLDAVGTSMSHAWTPIVWVTTMLNSDGDTIWVVVSPRNQFDGACT